MIILNFNSIRWQENITENLKKSISAKTLGHAILFSADVAAGVALSHATADSVLCKEGTGNACLKCSNCIKTTAGSHPDKFVIKTDKATIGVTDIREMINQMYVKPCNSDYKIFILEEAWKLTTQAQNALLKILEQPPEYGIIILVTEKDEDLLPTVLSRLKIFHITQPRKEVVSQYLSAKYPEKKELASFAASYYECDPYGAEQFLLKDCDSDKRKRILTYMQKLTLKDKSVIFDFANYLTQDKEMLETNIAYIQLFLRDILMIKNGFDNKHSVNSDLYEATEKVSRKYSVNNIELFSSALGDIISGQKKNASLKLNVTNKLIMIWEELHGRNSRN